MQYIQADGTKRFAKESRKEGCFHVIGGFDELAKAPALVICEGYATAATSAMALQFPTIAAFDSGNLIAVAQTLQEKFPQKPVIILGDDDRHLEMTQGTNPGKDKAKEAAKAVDGTVIFPTFSPSDIRYPAELPPINRQNYRQHVKAENALRTAPENQKPELKKALLSDEQLAALQKIKRYTDFNDLVNKSSLGCEQGKRQIESAVKKIIDSAKLARKSQHPIQKTYKHAH